MPVPPHAAGPGAALGSSPLLSALQGQEPVTPAQAGACSGPAGPRTLSPSPPRSSRPQHSAQPRDPF